MKLIAKTMAASAIALALSACSSLPEISPLGGADDANASVPRGTNVSVTEGAVDYRPVEPKPWTADPAPKPGAAK